MMHSSGFHKGSLDYFDIYSEDLSLANVPVYSIVCLTYMLATKFW